MANSITASIADYPVGMAYLLGNWATDRQANAVSGRRGDCQLISSMFDVSPAMVVPIDQSAWLSIV